MNLAYSAFKAPKNKTTAVSLILATLTTISHTKISEMRSICPLSAPGKGPEDEPLLDRFRDARKALLNALKGQGACHKLGRDVEEGCGRPTRRLAAVPVVQAAGAVRAVPLAAAAAVAAAAVVMVASGLDHFHHDDDVAAGALGAQRNSFGLLSGPLSQSSEHDYFFFLGGGHSR